MKKKDQNVRSKDQRGTLRAYSGNNWEQLVTGTAKHRGTGHEGMGGAGKTKAGELTVPWGPRATGGTGFRGQPTKSVQRRHHDRVETGATARRGPGKWE